MTIEELSKFSTRVVAMASEMGIGVTTPSADGDYTSSLRSLVGVIKNMRNDSAMAVLAAATINPSKRVKK